MKFEVISSVLRTDRKNLPIDYGLGLDQPQVGTFVVDGRTLVSGWFKSPFNDSGICLDRSTDLTILSANADKPQLLPVKLPRFDVEKSLNVGFRAQAFISNYSGIYLQDDTSFRSPLVLFKLVAIDEILDNDDYRCFCDLYSTYGNDFLKSIELLFTILFKVLNESRFSLGRKSEFSKLRKEISDIGQKYDSIAREIAIKIINKAVLLPYNLEITAHGVTKTFKFWSHQEKKSYLQASLKTISILNDAGYSSFLSYGTALGLIRDGDLIGHDDDIDITVIVQKAEDDNKQIEHLHSILTQLGLNPSGDFKMHRHIKVDGWNMDVFLATLENDVLNVRGFRSFEIRSSAVLPVKKSNVIEYQDLSIVLPAEPEEFLEAYYGKSWRTPIVGYYFT